MVFAQGLVEQRPWTTMIYVPLGTGAQPPENEKSSQRELFSFSGGEGGIRTHGTI
jgi:hypothetical protein